MSKRKPRKTRKANWWYQTRKRDQTCRVCHKLKKVMQVHHVRGRRIPDPNNLDNLAYLCSGCHRLISLVSFSRTVVRDTEAFERLVNYVKLRVEGP